MPKIPSGKTRLEVLISKEINEQIRKLIALKYGTFQKGLLSREVEEALAHWIRVHTHRHTNSFVVERVNPQPKVFHVFEEVRNYLRKKYKFLPQQVTWKDLEEAISAIRGSDRRTIKKWINLFIKWKLVKPIAPEVYEII